MALLLLAHPLAASAQLYRDGCDLTGIGEGIVHDLYQHEERDIKERVEMALLKLTLGCLASIPLNFGGFGSLSGWISGLIGGVLRNAINNMLRDLQEGICRGLGLSWVPASDDQLRRAAIASQFPVAMAREYV